MPAKSNKISELEAKIADLNERLLRSLADYANLQKRQQEQQQIILSLSQAAIVTPLIDVLEDFYRANDHLQDSGLKMTIDRLVTVLKDQGLEEIDANNKPFDPEIMECVETTDGKPDTVVAIRRRGYRLNGHCLRPVQVVVGQKKSSN